MINFLNKKGITARDIIYMSLGILPLTVFVGMGIYGLVGSLL